MIGSNSFGSWLRSFSWGFLRSGTLKAKHFALNCFPSIISSKCYLSSFVICASSSIWISFSLSIKGIYYLAFFSTSASFNKPNLHVSVFLPISLSNYKFSRFLMSWSKVKLQWIVLRLWHNLIAAFLSEKHAW